MNNQVLPMFPLPDFFLFPSAVVPLHIFEERYRQMVNDLLDTAGRLVIVSIPKRLTGHGVDAPPVFPYGGLAEIIHHERFEDGRFLILLMGLCRVRIEEVPQNKLYRAVRVELVESIACDEDEARRLRPLLEAAISDRTMQKMELSRKLPIDTLADILLQSLKLAPAQLEEVFAEQDERIRAESALAWHAIGS